MIGARDNSYGLTCKTTTDTGHVASPKLRFRFRDNLTLGLPLLQVEVPFEADDDTGISGGTFSRERCEIYVQGSTGIGRLVEGEGDQRCGQQSRAEDEAAKCGSIRLLPRLTSVALSAR